MIRTRYMNVQGMLPFENEVTEYVEKTNNHVPYMVTPIFENDNLLATGVLMEACSVEDNGKGVCFNVLCYNAQPGIGIDYKTGESRLISKVCNKNTKKFYLPTCASVKKMKEKNKIELNGTVEKIQL